MKASRALIMMFALVFLFGCRVDIRDSEVAFTNEMPFGLVNVEVTDDHDSPFDALEEIIDEEPEAEPLKETDEDDTGTEGNQ